MTGGAFILGCDSDMIEALVPSQTLGDISLEEAQAWVLKEYLPRFSNENAKLAGKEYKQELNWKSAKKIKKADGQEFVWVPVEVPKNTSLAIVSWDDTTEYRRKLPKSYFQPIIQGLIVIEEKGKKQAYLAQVAYDPFALKGKGKDAKLSLADFTGTLLLVDWDNTLINGRSLKGGRVKKSFSVDGAKGGRKLGCRQEYYEYQVVTFASCGSNCLEVTVTLVRGHQMVCTEETDSPPDDLSAGGYHSPSINPDYFGGGHTGLAPLVRVGPTYNLQNAISAPGPDRTIVNTELKNALYATGLAVNIGDLNFDVAEALVRVIGGNVEQFEQLELLGKRVGAVGFVIDGVQFGMGLFDGEGWSEDDSLNMIQFALGGAGLIAGGWIAVGIGAVSIGIAVYAQRK